MHTYSSRSFINVTDYGLCDQGSIPLRDRDFILSAASRAGTRTIRGCRKLFSQR
jgi:hypothetical protein